MARKEQADANAPAVGEDVAAVNEPTRYANEADEREAPAYVVATEELYAYGVRAHLPGDLVPVANVEKHNWQNGTKAVS